MRRCAETLEPEMSCAEQQFLRRLLRDDPKSGAHLEIGTAAGGTLVSMMQMYADGKRPPFVVVDRLTYFPDQMQRIERNLQNHGLDRRDVQFRQTTSHRAFAKAASLGERFDFILIDASHKIVSVTADLRWARLLNPGGTLCLHDVGPKFPGVQYAVNRFLRRNLNYSRAGQVDTLLALRKTAPSRTCEVTASDRVHSLAWHVPLEIHRRRQKQRQLCRSNVKVS